MSGWVVPRRRHDGRLGWGGSRARSQGDGRVGDQGAAAGGSAAARMVQPRGPPHRRRGRRWRRLGEADGCDGLGCGVTSAGADWTGGGSSSACAAAVAAASGNASTSGAAAPGSVGGRRKDWALPPVVPATAANADRVRAASAGAAAKSGIRRSASRLPARPVRVVSASWTSRRFEDLALDPPDQYDQEDRPDDAETEAMPVIVASVSRLLVKRLRTRGTRYPPKTEIQAAKTSASPRVIVSSPPVFGSSRRATSRTIAGTRHRFRIGMKFSTKPSSRSRPDSQGRGPASTSPCGSATAPRR